MSDKYPRSLHFKFSPGNSKDDKMMNKEDTDFLLGRELVFTEKMDGSNVCLTKSKVFSRSHSGEMPHKSFDRLKSRHAILKSKIPSGISIFGEWLYAVHSINYLMLPDHLMIFGIRDDELDMWWSWDDTANFSEKNLAVPTVPFILRGKFYDDKSLEKAIKDLAGLNSAFGPIREGLVVRLAGELDTLPLGLAGKKLGGLGKFVRKDHVQSDEHWTRKKIVVQPSIKAS